MSKWRLIGGHSPIIVIGLCEDGGLTTVRRLLTAELEVAYG